MRNILPLFWLLGIGLWLDCAVNTDRPDQNDAMIELRDLKMVLKRYQALPEIIELHNPKAIFILQDITQPAAPSLQKNSTDRIQRSPSQIYEMTSFNEILPVTITNSSNIPLIARSLKKLNSLYLGLVLLDETDLKTYVVLLNKKTGKILDFTDHYDPFIDEETISDWQIDKNYLYFLSAQTLFKYNFKERSVVPVNHSKYDSVRAPYQVSPNNYILSASQNIFQEAVYFLPYGGPGNLNPPINLTRIPDRYNFYCLNCQDYSIFAYPFYWHILKFSFHHKNGLYANCDIYCGNQDFKNLLLSSGYQFVLKFNFSPTAIEVDIAKIKDVSLLGEKYVLRQAANRSGHFYRYFFYRHGYTYVDDNLDIQIVKKEIAQFLPIQEVDREFNTIKPIFSVYAYDSYLFWIDQGNLFFWDVKEASEPRIISDDYRVVDYTVGAIGVFFTAYVKASEIGTFFIDFNRDFDILQLSPEEAEIQYLAEF